MKFTKDRCRPFLKWAGNKFKVLDSIISEIPETSTRLIEPFIGSGSLFINRPIDTYIGADLNADLINVFKSVQDFGLSFINDDLTIWFTQKYFGEEKYYEVRKMFNEHKIYDTKRAAMFIFLNQHGFNGLCRYNKYGDFTTPYNKGFLTKKKPAVIDLNRYETAITKSKNATFINSSFESVMAMAQPGDVIYCDPPYLPSEGKDSTFTEYATGDGFGYKQHKLMVDLAEQLATTGVTTIISNHDSKSIRELYKNAIRVVELNVSRSMGRYNGHANRASELLVVYGQTTQQVNLLNF